MGWESLRCTTCNAQYHRPSGSLRLTCENCTVSALEQKDAELELLRATNAFLVHQFGTESPDRVLKGDAVIVVQGRTDEPLSVHKFVLSSRSSVFCKMFNTKMTEQDTGIVHIDDATLPVIRAVIKFCYDAHIDFTKEVTAEEVLEVAHKYDISLLQAMCEEQLIVTMTNNNLPNMLKLAKKFQAPVLQAAAWQHFKRNFDSVIGDVIDRFC